MDDRTILITGITGQQGGSVARALTGKGFALRGMTRNPEGDAAKALAGQGVEIVRGDLDDEASLRTALAGAWGVFAVQNTWEAGVEKEEAQGKRIATLARDVGVQHFVYSSVGSADRETGIPHFDNKFRVEETVRGLDFPSFAILRPVFFMENLVSPWFMNDDKLCTAMDPATKLQMIGVADVGQYGARLFTDAARWAGGAYDIAGDAVTMPEVAATLSRALGRTIEFVRIPIEEVRKNSEDFALMLEWFDRVGYDADIQGRARDFGMTPQTLAEWANARRAG